MACSNQLRRTGKIPSIPAIQLNGAEPMLSEARKRAAQPWLPLAFCAGLAVIASRVNLPAEGSLSLSPFCRGALSFWDRSPPGCSARSAN